MPTIEESSMFQNMLPDLFRLTRGYNYMQYKVEIAIARYRSLIVAKTNNVYSIRILVFVFVLAFVFACKISNYATFGWSAFSAFSC